MKEAKRTALEAAGFRVGTVAEFLALTDAENEMVELRVALAALVHDLRTKLHVTQAELAARMGSDQARISRLEGNEPSVSVDQMLEAAFTLGARRKDIIEAIAA